jgi:hypothetical protein
MLTIDLCDDAVGVGGPDKGFGLNSRKNCRTRASGSGLRVRRCLGEASGKTSCSGLRSTTVARRQSLRQSFLIALTLLLQPGNDVLIAAAHTGFAFVDFLVQPLT